MMCAVERIRTKIHSGDCQANRQLNASQLVEVVYPSIVNALWELIP